jgi:hypothetical protein
LNAWVSWRAVRGVAFSEALRGESRARTIVSTQIAGAKSRRSHDRKMHLGRGGLEKYDMWHKGHAGIAGQVSLMRRLWIGP